MSDDREVFHRLRNNYVDEGCKKWLPKFRDDPFFKLIIDMMNLKVTPTEAKRRRDQISGQVRIITKEYLIKGLKVEKWFLMAQDGMALDLLNLASISLLDR